MRLLVTLEHEGHREDTEALHVADQVAGSDADDRALGPDDQGTVPEPDAVDVVAGEPLGHDGPDGLLHGQRRHAQADRPGEQAFTPPARPDQHRDRAQGTEPGVERIGEIGGGQSHQQQEQGRQPQPPAPVLPDQDAGRQRDQEERRIRVDVRAGAFQVDIDGVDRVVPPGPESDDGRGGDADQDTEVQTADPLELRIHRAGGEGQEGGGEEIQGRDLVADPAVTGPAFHRRADIGIPEEPAVDDGDGRHRHQGHKEPEVGNLDAGQPPPRQRQADRQKERRRQRPEAKAR